MSDPSTPRSAARLRRPSWRDARLVVGVVLVLLSVALGARVVASFDDTQPVYAAARELVPGQRVSSDDLVIAQVRLGEHAERYVDGSATLDRGTHALQGVGPGELVPVAALGTAREASDKAVTVPVDPAAAATVRVGSVVDVWVSRRDPDASGVAYLDPALLLPGAVVARVPAEGGALGMGVERAAVQLVVPAEQVGAVISAVDQEARMTLVPAPRAVDDAP